MITQKEIHNNSRKYGVPATTIDKDWILSHFLNAFYSFEKTGKLFVLKGGTCIRKCYIEDYRFSEDLDFTLLNENFIVNKKFINSIIKKAREISGAKFFISGKINNQLSNNIPQGYEIIIKFWGANHNPNQKPPPPDRWHSKIKIDISFSEKVILKSVARQIFHNFSDKKSIDHSVNAYHFNEIVAEKLRSLIQRNFPRDIYDNYYFSKIVNCEDYPVIKQLLQKKASYKNIHIEDLNQFVNARKKNIIKNAWYDSLSHQIHPDKLPEFEEAYNSVHVFIENILNSY